MNKAEFDKFADEYRALHASNISLSGEEPDYFAEYKIRDLAAECFAQSRVGTDAPAVLDFGAGIGTSVPFFRKYLPHAQLTCIDVSTKSLEVGQGRFPGQARFMHFDGNQIPFPDASFNIAFAACVFHHIDHAEHVALLMELRRVLVPNGIAMVFEHNPYNPLTVHAVNTCPFDANAKLITAAAMQVRFRLAGFERPKSRYRIFFPRALRALRSLEKSMTWVPIRGAVLNMR